MAGKRSSKPNHKGVRPRLKSSAQSARTPVQQPVAQKLARCETSESPSVLPIGR